MAEELTRTQAHIRLSMMFAEYIENDEGRNLRKILDADNNAEELDKARQLAEILKLLDFPGALKVVQEDIDGLVAEGY